MVRSAMYLDFCLQRFVANVTLSFCLPLRRRGKQTKCRRSGWMPQRWEGGSRSKQWDGFKEWEEVMGKGCGRAQRQLCHLLPMKKQFIFPLNHPFVVFVCEWKGTLILLPVWLRNSALCLHFPRILFALCIQVQRRMALIQFWFGSQVWWECRCHSNVSKFTLFLKCREYAA